MKAIKLTDEQFKRSLKGNVEHLWVYNKKINDKKIHNNSFSLNQWKGKPQMCVVIDDDKNIQDYQLEKIFGKGSFINGAVSPCDKEQMVYDCYYIKLKN
tara:strand:- start:2107 stop:2403 length:297 start_codon:yes stop_codon:yes gene_type:complete